MKHISSTVVEAKRSTNRRAKIIAEETGLGLNTVINILKRERELFFEELATGAPVNLYGIVTVDPFIGAEGDISVRSRTSSTLISRLSDIREEKGLHL